LLSAVLIRRLVLKAHREAQDLEREAAANLRENHDVVSA
jgi:hypothetical protein